jgi:sugar transferase (PEP-CTERM/EpsH1 system associated)
MATSAPISIVHVIHHLVVGGMENGVVNLINRLPREKFHHAVICIEDYSDFRERIERPNVELHALHRSKIGSVRLRFEIFKLLRRLRPHIVHSRGLSGLDALLPARLAGSITVHSEHGFDVDNLMGRAARPTLLRRLHAPLVRHYVVVSQDLGRLLISDVGIKSKRVTQIYNGVDTERFRPPKLRRYELLPVELRAEDLFVVGAVGRVRPIKDQATLVRAFAKVFERRPDWRRRLRLALVGDGPLLRDLAELAQRLEISDHVWFAGSRHDVDCVLQAMDLFVLPSLNEGISNTVLEAMATGIPVLATAVGGNVELLSSGVFGASFTPGDHETLANLIETYARDGELCARHGAVARRCATQHFSLEAMLAGYQRLYEGLAAIPLNRHS